MKIVEIVCNGMYGAVRCYNTRTNRAMAEFFSISLPDETEYVPCTNPEYRAATVTPAPGVTVRFCQKWGGDEWVDYHPQASVDPLAMLDEAGIAYEIAPGFIEYPVIDDADVIAARAAITVLPNSIHEYVDGRRATAPALKFTTLEGVGVTDPLGVLPSCIW